MSINFIAMFIAGLFGTRMVSTIYIVTLVFLSRFNGEGMSYTQFDCIALHPLYSLNIQKKNEKKMNLQAN